MNLGAGDEGRWGCEWTNPRMQGCKTREERGREMGVCMHASRTRQVKNRHINERRDRVPLVSWSLCVSCFTQRIKGRRTGSRSCCWKDGRFSQILINYRWRWDGARHELHFAFSCGHWARRQWRLRVSRLCGGREVWNGVVVKACLHTLLFMCLCVLLVQLRSFTNSSFQDDGQLHCARWKLWFFHGPWAVGIKIRRKQFRA